MSPGIEDIWGLQMQNAELRMKNEGGGERERDLTEGNEGNEGTGLSLTLTLSPREREYAVAVSVRWSVIGFRGRGAVATRSGEGPVATLAA